MKKLIKQFIVSALNSYHYYLLRKSWHARHQKVKAELPIIATSRGFRKHTNLWDQLNKKYSLDTFNICRAISGQEDYRFVPEELFEGVIEKKLNKDAPRFLEHKSFYSRLFPDTGFIENLFHKIGGFYYSADYDLVSQKDLLSLIEQISYPVIIKKSIDTAGGRDVHFANTSKEVFDAIEKYEDLVVQPVLKPHPYFKEFHDVGLNTIRACLYRSVVTGEVFLLNTTLRIGRDGHLDNETQGGLVCNLDDTGKLNSYVVDKYGKKFLEHPNSLIKFAEHPNIPDFQQLKCVAIKAAERIPYAHVISLDLAMDDKGKWKLIEVNLWHQTIRFAQYAGKSFFGDHTGEIVRHCS